MTESVTRGAPVLLADTPAHVVGRRASWQAWYNCFLADGVCFGEGGRVDAPVRIQSMRLARNGWLGLMVGTSRLHVVELARAIFRCVREALAFGFWCILCV